MCSSDLRDNVRARPAATAPGLLVPLHSLASRRSSQSSISSWRPNPVARDDIRARPAAIAPGLLVAVPTWCPPDAWAPCGQNARALISTSPCVTEASEDRNDQSKFEVNPEIDHQFVFGKMEIRNVKIRIKTLLIFYIYHDIYISIY